MSIKFKGDRCTPKEFAKLWMYDNMCSLHENCDTIFDKFPEKYNDMTDRERTVVKECLEKVLNTMERCLGLEKTRAKKTKLK